MALKIIKRIYEIILCVSIFVAGALLIAGSLYIYFTGELRNQIYTTEIVSNVFWVIAIPVFICILLITGSFIFDFFSPKPEEKPKTNTDFMLDALKEKRVDTSPEIKKERKFRRTNAIILTALTLVTSVIFIVYAINPLHYHQSEINASMINAMKWLFACLAVPFVFAVISAYINEKSKKRELALLKEADKKQPTPVKVNSVPMTVARIAIVAVAAGILVYGFVSGGTADVLTKAINICTECIGLG